MTDRAGWESKDEGERRAAAGANIAHLLRRAGFGGTASPDRDARRAAAGRRPSTSCSTSPRAPADAQPAFLTDANIGDWEKEYQLQQWWLDRMATTPDAAPGEAHAVLARALRDRELQGHATCG